MATRKLKLQVLDNLKDLVWAVIILGVVIYTGIQVFMNGAGKRFESEKGLWGVIRRFLYDLEDSGHGDLVSGILLTILGAIALICIFLIIYHLGRMTPKRSVLGRSILAQAAEYEDFKDLVQVIDADLSMESQEFGTELVAGTLWLLSEKEAMRIGRIERIYIGKKKIEMRNRDMLVAADGEGNTMTVPFAWDQNRDEAVQFLRRKVLGLYVGNLTEIE